MGGHTTAAVVVMSLALLGCSEPQQHEERSQGHPTTKVSTMPGTRGHPTTRVTATAPAQVKIRFGSEMARLAKHKQAVVILAAITSVETERLLFGETRQTIRFDVKRVHHFGEDVTSLLRDYKFVWAYNDGKRFTKFFGVKPFPRDSIEKGGTYWLAVAMFGSSGIWVVARERVRPK